MKNRFVRVTVVTIVVSLFYFTFFTEKVTDKVKKETTINENRVASERIDTLLHEKGYLVIGKSNVVKIVALSDTVNYKGFYIAETDGGMAILTKKEDKDDLQVYKEFSAESQFDNYKVQVYKGKLVDPDFSTNSEAKMFVTRITDGCKSGINFAGHYTLIYWGCGTACQFGVVVDRKTGEIFSGYQTSLGSVYRKDSKLIIMNSDYLEENTNYIPLYQLKEFQLKLWEYGKFSSLKN